MTVDLHIPMLIAIGLLGAFFALAALLCLFQIFTKIRSWVLTRDLKIAGRREVANYRFRQSSRIARVQQHNF